MITVITNENTVSNEYAGMSISEVCSQLVLETVEAGHELEMDILLTEHQYLYENGVEIEYIDEAEEGEAKEGKLAQLKNKVINFIQTIKKKIREAFNALILKIGEIREKIVEVFRGKGLTKNKFDQIIKYYEDGSVTYMSSIEYKMWGIRNWEPMFGKTATAKTYEKGEAYAAIITKKDEPSEIKVMKSRLEDARNIIFGENMTKQIREAQKTADGEIDKLIKETREAKGEQLTEKLDALKKVSVSNSIVASDIIKAFNDRLNDHIALAKAAYKSASVAGGIATEKANAKAAAKKEREERAANRQSFSSRWANRKGRKVEVAPETKEEKVEESANIFFEF